MKEMFDQPNSKEAEDVLASVDSMTLRGTQRGLYPRWFAIGFSLWGAALAVTIETAAWLIIFVVGLLGYVYYRRKRGVWIKEIQRKRDFWIVISGSALVGIAYLCAFVGLTYYGLTWAPYVAGLFIFIMLYTTTEVVYSKLWAAQNERSA